LLVAIAVLAVLSTISFRGLSSILNANSAVESETRRWNDVSLVFENMGRDIALAVPRSVRDETGASRAGLLVSQDQGSGAQLQIARLGDSYDGSRQGDLRRVGYRLRDQALEYVVWSAVDLAPNATPNATPILEGVSELRIRVIGQDGSWTSSWPTSQDPTALPRAIEIQLTLSGGVRITRIFSVR